MKRNNWRRKSVIKSAFSEFIIQWHNDRSMRKAAAVVAILLLVTIPIGSCNDEKRKNEIIEQESYAVGYNQGFEEGCAVREESISELQQDKEKLIEEVEIQVPELYTVYDALGRVTSELSDLVSRDLYVIFDELGTVPREYTSDAMGSVLVKLDAGIDTLSDLSAEQLAILDELCAVAEKLFNRYS